ncbi:MAG: indolepyruvate ferredoxin oxidoreductase family protein [Acidimicrobiales bacterium]
MTDVMGRPAARPALQDLDAKYRETEGQFFFTGVQALVRVPLDQMRADRRAGLRTASFISGYQGSPLGGFDREIIAHKALMDEHHIVHRSGLNEELGATAVWGSQLANTFPDPLYDGVLGIWYGKAPGLDRAGDAIRHAAYSGTGRHGGVLALTGDDPACKSSTLPSSSEFSLADLHLPVLHPGSVQEVLDLSRHGVYLSRASGLWSAIKIVTSVADAAASAEVGPDRIRPVMPTFLYRGQQYQAQVSGKVGPPMTTDMERELYEARLQVARLYGVENNLNAITHDAPDAWIGLLASGRVYHEVLEALHTLGLSEADLTGLGIRLIQIGMMYPLDATVMRRLTAGLAEVMVVEEKRNFLELHLKEALYGVTDAPLITGKHDPSGIALVPAWGALDADALVEPIFRRLGTRVDAARLRAPHAAPSQGVKRRIELLPARTPFFCSGCPHNTGTKVPDGSLVGAGIGCHGMVTLMDPERVGTIMGITQMGGEGSNWVGIEPFVKTDHYIQNMGDGTFAHSGSLSVRMAVSAGAHITFKILYNSAVAMTGGQDAAGAMTVPALTYWLRSEGVARTIVTTDDPGAYKGVELAPGTEVWQREKIIEAQETLKRSSGVTVLIHDQQCAAEKRRDRKRGLVADPATRIVINERVCEGCGDCGVQSNCLSVQPVETEFGRKTRIHQSSCNKDYSCLAGDCPSFLSVVPQRSSLLGRLGAARRKVTGGSSGSGASGAGGRTSRSEGGARRRPAIDEGRLIEPTLVVSATDATIRMPGIGGTGVVTVSQILGTAATLDGKFVTGLDQTGLSQKAGPVVSDLRIATAAVEGSNKTTAGGVDLYLVFDQLVGLGANNIIGCDPARTVAVVSVAKSPTGAMLRDPRATYPADADLRADLDAVTRADHNRYLDAGEVALGLFGDSTTANVLQLGVAYQLGAVPISAGAIEQAIELNGAAVEANKAAFRWGRMWAIDPAAVRAASQLPAHHLPKPSAALEADIVRRGLGDGELGRLVRLRAADLVAYQDHRYTDRYLEVLSTVAAAGQIALTEAVARNLYKLMAYKDEYEVARLHLETAAKIHVENEVGAQMVVSYNLHPPVLRALGMDGKIRLGPWFTPVLGQLQKGKKLRGTALDPFGYAKVRRVERQLAKEYGQLVQRLAGRFASGALAVPQLPTAVDLANLPDLVRGYEQIKLDNVEIYQSELARLRAALGV